PRGQGEDNQNITENEFLDSYRTVLVISMHTDAHLAFGGTQAGMPLPRPAGTQDSFAVPSATKGAARQTSLQGLPRVLWSDARRVFWRYAIIDCAVTVPQVPAVALM